MRVVRLAGGKKFSTKVPLLIVGAGAAGLCAALAAKEAGAEVVVVERDAVPTGSTALSAGLIPAAGTRFQRIEGIDDSPESFAEDIQRKARGEADPAVVETVTRAAGPLPLRTTRVGAPRRLKTAGRIDCERLSGARLAR